MIRYDILQNDEAAKKYFEAVWALKDLNESPWPGQEGRLSLYDFFVFWHHRAMMLSTPPNQSSRNAAHSGPVFLPWHRYMLLRFEAMLGEAIGDPDFRLPYWDWSQDHDVNSPAWGDDYLGQFMDTAFEVRFDQNSFGSNPLPVTNPRPLRRFLGQWPGVQIGDKEHIRNLIQDINTYDESPFDGSVFQFRNLLEGWRGPFRLHNNVHLFVGGRADTGEFGDMVLSTSPNDPVFFLHHCFIDKVWAAWQKNWHDAPYVPGDNAPDIYRFHRLNDPMHTFFNEQVTPADMLDISNDYAYDTLDDLLLDEPVVQ